VRLVNALLLAAGLAALAWMISRLGLDSLAAAAARVGWASPAAIAAHFASLLVASVSLILAVGAPLRFPAAFAIEMAGHAVNEATPMAKLGELTKYGMLADRVPAERAAAGVIVWNIGLFVAAAITIAIACVVALVTFDVAPAARTLVVIAAIANALAAALAVGVLYLRVGTWPFALLRRLRISKERVERWRAGWLRVEEAWSTVAADRRRLAGIFAVSLAVRALNVAEGALILAALGAEPLLASALAGYAAFQLTAWLIGFVPLQVGTAEGGSYVAFTALGLPGAHGVVLELTRKLRRLLFIAVGLVILALGLARPAAPGTADEQVQTPNGK
jgi:uncharacterized protein (TIRG00374 family)